MHFIWLFIHQTNCCILLSSIWCFNSLPRYSFCIGFVCQNSDLHQGRSSSNEQNFCIYTHVLKIIDCNMNHHSYIVLSFLKGDIEFVSTAIHPIHYVFVMFHEVIYNKEEDVGTYTIRAIDDPRTLNKIMYLRPPANIYSTNDLVSLWERKIGKSLKRIYVPEEEVLKKIRGGFFKQSNKLSILIFYCMLLNHKLTNNTIAFANHFVFQRLHIHLI